VFPLGIDGVVMPGPPDGCGGGQLRNVIIRTTRAWGSRPALGVGNGLKILSLHCQLDNVWVNGFSGHGLYVAGNPTVPGANANIMLGNKVRALFNGCDGIHLSGSDANACLLSGADVTENGRYGIFNDGLYHNTFVLPHASGNVTGDYFDDGWSSQWLNPYSENSGKFVIGHNSRYGVLIAGGYGAPSLWTSDAEMAVTQYATTAASYGWTILHTGEWIGRGPSVRSQFGNHRLWEHRIDDPSVGDYALIHSSGGRIFTANGQSGNSTFKFQTAKLGFFDATPAAQPSVTGTTDSEKIDSLITALASIGIVSDGTT